MKRCIINIATRNRDIQGQERLRNSVKDMGIDCLFFQDTGVIGSPSHQEIPYAFKPFAFNYAKELGYDSILWVDAAVWAIQDISPLFDHIEKEGYLLFRNGWTTGEWCADSALEPLAITREESFEYPHLMACVMGLNLNNEKSNCFFHEWLRQAKDGTAFKGSWSNENKQCSQDSRVLGHRHDQTVASIISCKLDMRNWLIPHETFLLYFNNQEVPIGIILLTQGM